MTSDQFREWASDLNPQLRLAWYGPHNIEIRLYDLVNRQSWSQEGVCRSEPELAAWLRGYRQGRRSA